MDILKGLMATLLFGATAHAAPPVDLSNVEGVERRERVREKPIKEDEMIFTDVNAPEHPRGVGRLLRDVAGRSQPGREGEAMFVIRRGSAVKLLKKSPDGRWAAVQDARSGRKAWIPASAIALPPKKAKPAN